MPGPVPPTATPPATTSKVALGLGVGGASFAAWLVDRVMLDGGDQAAAVLTKLGPVLGPAWASWPVILLLIVVAWLASDRWKAAQLARAAEVAAAQASATALATSVGEVATGLVGLRAEVHSLRGALQDHATATDERLRHHEAGLADVRAEVGHVRGRVDALERPATRPSRTRR